MSISIKKRGNNMGTSTERYHRKKRLRKQQEERQGDIKKKLEKLIEKNRTN